MKISFVIVNYNRQDELLTTIAKSKKTIDETPGNFEIVIVDNASTDGSVAAIKAQHPDVVLIENPVNTGAPAWNLGFAKATGDYFIVLDDDSHIDSGLSEALNYLEQHPEVGVLALNIAGGAYNTAEWIDMQEMAGFIGCGTIIRKELYQKIGGYADWIFLYTNEWEYGIRTLQAGYKIIYYEKCRVTHRTSSINRTTKRLIVFSVRNEMATVYKYFSKTTRGYFAFRVYLNNLKGIFKYGLSSIPWYYEALRDFYKWKKTMIHTPVKKEVENFYRKNFWSTNPFFKFLLPAGKGQIG